MANADAMQQVKKIILSDPDRKYVVVSAPGKRNKEDIKITDTLYACYDEVVSTPYTCARSSPARSASIMASQTAV